MKRPVVSVYKEIAEELKEKYIKKTGEDSFPESEFDKKTNKMSFGDKITALFIIIGFIVFVYMFAFLSP